ncbi:hypothetical protein CKM354_000146900 [Cercospora kikuchii]|uniref:N-acetyltransferase domain-containing protein n=1 Tax=Cercospora kikuchii TaxID=84275 RepID=A0A9P3FBX7_9PEZI|nr:uncharacterized protein CKM354_000146900 [Cercospora kikuchii]GIZ38042.1 hypothetical protein CKM354_000146900 [Cercospora kikuchii]
MAIGNIPKTCPGPQLKGRDTMASIFSSAQIGTSRYLANLVKTINDAFRQAHASKPELGMTTQGERLGSTEEFLANLSSDPESFILIISYPESDNVIATASYRRYHGPLKDRPVDRNTPWFRTSDVSPDTEEWEMKLMACDLDFQGYGLAGYMMKTGEAEIVQSLKLVICTPLELTAQFYLRRGFTMDYQVWRGEGYNFHIAFMHRIIEPNSK